MDPQQNAIEPFPQFIFGRCLRRMYDQLRVPAYATELNPVEAHWSTSKNSWQANYVSEHVDDFNGAIVEAVGDAALDQNLSSSFFQSARLPL